MNTKQDSGFSAGSWGPACHFICGLGPFWPLNSYIESPGTADDLKAYVKVKDHPDRGKGSFMITSVYLQQARPATWVWAKLTPHTTIESAAAVTGGQSSRTYNKVQDFYMQSAINEAIAVAFKAAHQEYHKEYLGIYVLSVQKNSRFSTKSRLAIRSRRSTAIILTTRRLPAIHRPPPGRQPPDGYLPA